MPLLLSASWLALVLFGPFGARADLRTCGNYIEHERGVWLSGGEFLPFYNDLELIAYLNSLGGGAATGGARRRVTVLPVLSDSPVAIRTASRIYVSTNVLLGVEGESDLIRTLNGIRLGRSGGAAASLPECSRISTFRPFVSFRVELAARLADYAESRKRKLRIR